MQAAMEAAIMATKMAATKMAATKTEAHRNARVEAAVKTHSRIVRVISRIVTTAEADAVAVARVIAVDDGRGWDGIEGRIGIIAGRRLCRCRLGHCGRSRDGRCRRSRCRCLGGALPQLSSMLQEGSDDGRGDSAL